MKTFRVTKRQFKKLISETLLNPPVEFKMHDGMANFVEQLDELGVEYQISNSSKKVVVIYKPINQTDRFYDKFDKIIDLNNAEHLVKSKKYTPKPIKK